MGWSLGGLTPPGASRHPPRSEEGFPQRPALFRVGHLFLGRMCRVDPSPKRGRWLGRRPRRMGWSLGGLTPPGASRHPPRSEEGFPQRPALFRVGHLFLGRMCRVDPSPKRGRWLGRRPSRMGWSLGPKTPPGASRHPPRSEEGCPRRPALFRIGHLFPGQMCRVDPSPKRGRWLGRRPRRMGWSLGPKTPPGASRHPPGSEEGCPQRPALFRVGHLFLGRMCRVDPSPKRGKVARPQAESDGVEPGPEDPTRRFAPPSPFRGGISQRPALFRVGHLFLGRMCRVDPSPKRGRWLGRRPGRMGWSLGRKTPPVASRHPPRSGRENP